MVVCSILKSGAKIESFYETSKEIFFFLLNTFALTSFVRDIRAKDMIASYVMRQCCYFTTTFFVVPSLILMIFKPR